MKTHNSRKHEHLRCILVNLCRNPTTRTKTLARAPGEVVYRDKGYFGVRPRGFDATMRRGVRGHPLGIRGRLRNRRINRKRAPVERPFAVIKRVFGSGHVLVTTVQRVHVKMVFACFCFNLVQLGTLAARS